MSHLTVVRHGQASFFADDYDQLSPLGEHQAFLLGELWGKQQRVIDEVYSGPRMRQQKSAEKAGDAYRKAGLKWPEVTVLDELDEYDLDGLTNRFTPRLAKSDSEFAGLVDRYRKSEGEQNQLRNFQRMFETMLRHWQLQQSDSDDFESWPAFRERVAGVIRHIQMQSGRSRRVVLFTSGGFIGTAVQQSLGSAEGMALELNWRIRNSSQTEFVFTADRFTLESFNTIPHLPDPTFWTFR